MRKQGEEARRGAQQGGATWQLMLPHAPRCTDVRASLTSDPIADGGEGRLQLPLQRGRVLWREHGGDALDLSEAVGEVVNLLLQQLGVGLVVGVGLARWRRCCRRAVAMSR